MPPSNVFKRRAAYVKGNYPVNYFKQPNSDKPIEQIWEDIDAYSGEFFPDEPQYYDKIDLIIPLPPLKYNGVFTKGILLTQGAEHLLNLYPDLKKLFFVGAYTMWSSYSWCDKADLYFACYENKPREIYHKNKYQNKKDIIFIPLQDADYTNEYTMAPAFNVEREYDILSVATPYEVKNHIMIAQAVKEYEKKYGKKLKVKFVLGKKDIKKNNDGKIDLKSITDNPQRKIIEAVYDIMGDNIPEIEPYIPHNDLNRCYSSAKCLVLASLIEGKNRSINEALSCDTPVVVFKAHNQWARGEYPIFYGNSGELADEFTPDSLADAMHKIIKNSQNYEPRKNYLMYNGRKNFINTCAKYIPYYKENIPDLSDNNIANNLWVDLASQKLYQVSFLDFLYGKSPHICWVQGMKRIDFLIKYYYFMFGINQEENH